MFGMYVQVQVELVENRYCLIKGNRGKTGGDASVESSRETRK